MEKLKYVVPTIEYEKEAIDFINEFYEYNSEINGTGGLQRFLDNYPGWLFMVQDYIFDVDKCLESTRDVYEPLVCEQKIKY